MEWSSGGGLASLLSCITRHTYKSRGIWTSIIYSTRISLCCGENDSLSVPRYKETWAAGCYITTSTWSLTQRKRMRLQAKPPCDRMMWRAMQYCIAPHDITKDKDGSTPIAGTNDGESINFDKGPMEARVRHCTDPPRNDG